MTERNFPYRFYFPAPEPSEPPQVPQPQPVDEKPPETPGNGVPQPSRPAGRPSNTASEERWRAYAEQHGIDPAGLNRQQIRAAVDATQAARPSRGAPVAQWRKFAKSCGLDPGTQTRHELIAATRHLNPNSNSDTN